MPKLKVLVLMHTDLIPPVEFTEKPVSVIAPVPLASLITLKPPLDRTGPLKVEFAIIITPL